MVTREMSSGTIAVNSYRREERALSRREIMSETRAVKLLTIQMLILTNEKLFHHNVPESIKRIYESAAHSTPISQNHHLSKYSECGQMVVPQNLRPPMRNAGMANRKGSRTHFLINNE